MIILIGGEKGGTGKTTIATNLAAIRAQQNKDVLLVDTDRQESASSWCYIREEEGAFPRISSVLKFGAAIRAELKVLSKKCDDVIVDAGGRDSIEFRAALLSADKALIPMRATQFDLWTLSRMNRLIDEVKIVNEFLEVFMVLNAASTHPNEKETNNAVTFLEEFPNLKLMRQQVIRERIAFHRAAAEGRSVLELSPIDSKAADEMKAIYKELFDEV